VGGAVPEDGAFVSTAISCSDGLPVEGNLEELKTFYNKFLRKSSFADIWTGWIRDVRARLGLGFGGLGLAKSEAGHS
jgi:hypothetical protein